MSLSLSPRRVVMTEFIEKYKNSECLWKVTDKNYKSKQHRQKALDELLIILKRIDSTANMDSVTKKINSMRSAYNKEYNKVKAASRSGIGAEDQYLPKLWYYDLLLFINERETEVESSCDINAMLNEGNDENEDQDMDMNEDQASPLSPRSEPPSRLNNKYLKRKEKNEVCEVLTKISKRLDSSTEKKKPTFSAFGEHVAEKLRTMNSDAAKYCQKIINDAIFYAEFNNLNYTSRIVTDHVHLDRSRSPSAHSQSSYLDRPSRSPSTQTSSSYYRYLQPLSTQTQTSYQSPNEQLDRPYRLSSRQRQSPYQSPNEQLDRPYRPSSRQTQSPYQSPNEQLDRLYRPPSTQTQSPYQSPNEHLDRLYRPPSTQIQSPYQSPNEQLVRPYRPSSRHRQSPYQSPNEQLDRPYRPSSRQQSPYQSPNEQLDRTLRSPETQTQLLPNAIVVNEIVDCLDQQDGNLLSSPIVAEGDWNTMKKYLIFKPRTEN